MTVVLQWEIWDQVMYRMMPRKHKHAILTLLLLNMTCPVLANCVDLDQLASEEANWSWSALFVIKYVNFYQQEGHDGP